MTTTDKVAYGVAAGAIGLYALKNTDLLDAAGTTTTFSTDPTTTDDSGLPIWVYGVGVVVILILLAYISREVAG